MGLKDLREMETGPFPPFHFDRFVIVTAIATMMLGQLYILQSLDNSLEYAGLAKIVIPVLYYWSLESQIAHSIAIVTIGSVKLFGLKGIEQRIAEMDPLPEKHPWNQADKNDRSKYHCSDCGVTVPLTAADIQSGIVLYCPVCDDEMIIET